MSRVFLYNWAVTTAMGLWVGASACAMVGGIILGAVVSPWWGLLSLAGFLSASAYVAR